MFYSKTTLPPQSRKIRVNVNNFRQIDDQTNEELLHLFNPTEMYNLHNVGGALTSGLGVTPATISTGVGESFYDVPEFTGDKKPRQLFMYLRYDKDKKTPDHLLIARDTEGYFYKVSICKANDTWTKLNFCFTEYATAINYRHEDKNLLLLCSKMNSLTIYDGTDFKLVNDAPRISSMCEHYGRIFASTYGEGNEVWFSDDYNPYNWNVSLNEAGYIKFSDPLGKVLKVVSFNDYVYVFREYAIHRLTAFGDQTNFEMVKVVELNERIYENSIAECRDKIMFMTSDGLYIFDGYNVKNVATEISLLKDLRSNYMCSGYSNGHYYLAFYKHNRPLIHDETGYFVNNYLLDYDIAKYRAEFTKGLNVWDILPVRLNSTSTCYLLVNGIKPNTIGMLDYSGKYYNQDLKYQYRSVKFYFYELVREKTIKKIMIDTEYDCTITLETDSLSYSFKVQGKKGYQPIIINKRCKWARLVLEGEGKANIKGLEFEVELVRG